MSRGSTPYSTQPAHAFWRAAVAEVAPGELDPVVSFALKIDRETRVATAGSCFAQHIARRLRDRGFNYYVAEPPHPMLTEDMAKAYNYGTFSARYGNLYTSRQLKQLVDRAYGRFEPSEDRWHDEQTGRWIDPFRPNIQPEGFASEEELLEDRAQHLAAVRTMFETLDVFVFTFGLTECWASRVDGAVYPMCPGVAGGTFDPAKHLFLNLTVADLMSDMRAFLTRLRELNPTSRVIFTVSPVPLAATAEQKHVLPATAYSKSILRVAAEMLCRERADTHYFPSYEIITSASSRGRYFAANCRDVTEEGVDHVMRLFFQHVAGEPVATPLREESPNNTQASGRDLIDRLQTVVEVICEEQLIETQAPPTAREARP